MKIKASAWSKNFVRRIIYMLLFIRVTTFRGVFCLLFVIILHYIWWYWIWCWTNNVGGEEKCDALFSKLYTLRKSTCEKSRWNRLSTKNTMQIYSRGRYQITRFITLQLIFRSYTSRNKILFAIIKKTFCSHRFWIRSTFN